MHAELGTRCVAERHFANFSLHVIDVVVTSAEKNPPKRTQPVLTARNDCKFNFLFLQFNIRHN